ncbi:hypothetical protein GOBAR_DD31249 [Gossypium barbadense]|nr:hypothetical protein GOBAR_DD31249 [Gossypium barbadense]
MAGEGLSGDPRLSLHGLGVAREKSNRCLPRPISVTRSRTPATTLARRFNQLKTKSSWPRGRERKIKSLPSPPNFGDPKSDSGDDTCEAIQVRWQCKWRAGAAATGGAGGGKVGGDRGGSSKRRP